jgi:hypothetical protein
MPNNAIKKAYKLKDRARRTAIRLAGQSVLSLEGRYRYTAARACYDHLYFAYTSCLKAGREEDVSGYFKTVWKGGIMDLTRILIEEWRDEHGGYLVKERSNSLTFAIHEP